MKRSGLERRSPLRAKKSLRGYSAAKAARLGRSLAGTRRRGVGAPERDGGRFQSGQSECQHQSCRDRSQVVFQHHVVYRQAVRRHGGDGFDPRNALALCGSCHANHHGRGCVLSLSVLRDENYAFAVDLLGRAAYDYLRRRYVGDDPRLERILDAPETSR